MGELVNIIITTYRRKSELRRAVESALNQTYKNISIIIVDDNIEKEYSEYIKNMICDIDDERIKYIKNSKNLGGALSRNVGIKNSVGNYIAFLDDDDEYLPHKIEKQLNLFKNSIDENLALVYCYCDAIKDEKIISHYRYDFIGNCLYDAMKMCFAATSQWMCRKDYLENVGCFSDVPCKQDSTVLIKLLAFGYTVDRVPEVLSLYHEEEIPRISDNNVKKRIIGITKLLELCRNNYEKILPNERKEVEYSFATELIIYYFMAGDKNKYKECLKIMNRVHFFGNRTIKTKMIILKKRIKKLIIKK